mmetsp:Transcript_24723/g.21894  ORF Transcript_24723/g.21894 Transcript_24723/m.21894 type:complete len:118 (-) Transcript_24723:260-613(-)
MSIYESPYKDWTEKILDNTLEYASPYLVGSIQGNCDRLSKNIVFLERNTQANKKKSAEGLTQSIQVNEIEWKFVPNTTKLVTSSFGRQELIYILKKKPTKEDKIKRATVSINRVARF